MRPQTISACLVICNEEQIIGRCLESIQGVVDEIVVVHDGPCRDASLDICRRYTDKIFVRSQVGIAEPHRVFSMEQATGEWVLWIDADESLTPELQNQLRVLVERPGVDMYCLLWPYSDGRRDLTLGLDHPYRSCLARRSKVRYYAVPQEGLRSSGVVRKAPLTIRHRPRYDNYTWKQFFTKWQPRNRITAEWVWRRPEEIPAFGDLSDADKDAILAGYRRRPLTMGLLRAFQTLAWHLWKGMWRVGAAGLRVAVLTALNAAAIRWWIFRLRPAGAHDAAPLEGGAR
jgi:glycosyltransferase involved in cell wall biosynthesis